MYTFICSPSMFIYIYIYTCIHNLLEDIFFFISIYILRYMESYNTFLCIVPILFDAFLITLPEGFCKIFLQSFNKSSCMCKDIIFAHQLKIVYTHLCTSVEFSLYILHHRVFLQILCFNLN